jgi:aminoglycoside 6'-N-acetyltransferase
MVRGALTTVRPASDADADLLVQWHADPDVSRYWDDRTFTREEMLERLARSDVEAFVVEAAGRPVGYLQAWRDGDEGGIDMFLVPGQRGRGLGPDAGRALARHLRDERGWPQVTVDPYTWNEPAIRAWRRAGFVDVEERPADDEHSADWLLMIWRG